MLFANCQQDAVTERLADGYLSPNLIVWAIEEFDALIVVHVGVAGASGLPAPSDRIFRRGDWCLPPETQTCCGVCLFDTKLLCPLPPWQGATKNDIYDLVLILILMM